MGRVQLTLTPAANAGVTSDNHASLNAAWLIVFGGIPWQRCQFHLQQNVQAYIPRKDTQGEVAEDIRTIFNAPDRNTAEAYLAKAVEKYRKNASRLAEWMVVNILEGLTVFSFLTACRRLLRSTMAWSIYTAKSAAGHA